MSSLLRSTKFVRYFTGAARTLILNSAKTAEANLLANPKTLSAANNVLLRDYATSKKTESLEPLLQKLDNEVRRYGRITKRDIDEVFDEIRAKNDITSSQSLLVIRCCGELVPEELPEQRTLLVQKIWSVLTERGVPMDISHYNALLRVYLENEHPFSPAKFLEELEQKGLQPNRVTYQRLMWRYCQEGDVSGATKVLEKMRELNMPVSEPVLNALVMGHSFHGDTEGAKAVLETMAGAGLQPTNRSYTLLACGYAKKGDIEGVESVIKTANEKDAYLTDKDILEIIEHLAIGGHGEKADKLFHHLNKTMGYNQDVCNLILKLLNKGQEETAKKIMSTMPKSAKTEDTIFKGAFFIKQLLRLNKPVDDLIKTCRELEKENLVPKATYIATEAALQLGNSELALRLFKELQKDGLEIRHHYYWPLLVQKGKENDEEGLLQIVRSMSNQGLQPTGETLRDYVMPYLMEKDDPQNVILKLQIANVPVIHSARHLMVELLARGDIKKAAEVAVQYRPRGQYTLIARALINAVTKTKDIDSFVTILQVLSTPANQQVEEDNDTTDDNANSHEIGRIVVSSIKLMSNPALAEKLLETLHSKGIRISTNAAESIEQCLGQHMTIKLSQLLTSLTSSELEIVPIESNRRNTQVARTSAQLEQLLARIKSQGGNNIHKIEKQLLLAYMKERNVEKVNSFVQELQSSKHDFTALTYAQLFDFYAENDFIDKAEEYKAKMAAADPDFELKKFKLVQMAYALIRANRYEDAVKFLKDNKPKADDENVFSYNSKCWQILNYLAEQKDVEKVKEMTSILIENNYIDPSNVILGPSIKVHLLRDDIDGALKEFEHCCKQYRSTPWKGELMKALIMKEDATKLQWLADHSTQIHGEVNILHDLVLAFVECGRLRQARRILETPGMMTRQKRLEEACQRYVEEGKSEHLEGLLEATKELSNIDRSNIFYHLLTSYIKSDETDKALGLWTILQEEGEVPSDEFLILLGKHLKQKKRDIPFVIPQMEKTAVEEEKPKPVFVKKPKVATPRMTKQEVTDKVEEMVKSGNLDEAMDYTISVLEQRVVPKSSVIKFLLRNLAEKGKVEKIQLLGEKISENLKRDITYDDKLTLAIFNKGLAAEHIDNILQEVKSAMNEQELDNALKKFPRSNALASIMQNDELVSKCCEIVDLAASKNKVMPANLLWMECVLSGKEKEADAIWKQHLSNMEVLAFRRLLQESHTRKQPELIQKLIDNLKSNKNVSLSSLGNAYSRLINYYLTENNVDEAKRTLEKALEFGVTSEHFNSNCIKRLKTEMESVGLEFKYNVN